MAIEAFERVLRSAQDRPSREAAMLGRGRALVEIGRHEEAVRSLEDMAAQYPTSGHMVELCALLSGAYGELGGAERDAAKRFERFNLAVRSLKTARKFEQTPGGQARLDLAVGRILALKAAAEEKFGSPQKALEYLDEAIATYQALILLGNAADPTVRPHMGDAYCECIPLLLRTGRWQDAYEDCDAYLEQYPAGRCAVDARAWRTQAAMKMTDRGGGAATSSPAEK